MRVLMGSSFWHGRGGDTTAMFATVRALEAAGHEVVPFAMRHPANRPSPWEARWPAWRDPRSARALGGVWSPGVAAALDRLLDDVRPDVAHLHHLHRFLTPSVLPTLRRRGVATAWTLHDYELVCPNGLLYTAGEPCGRCLGGDVRHAVRHRCKKGDLAASLAAAAEQAVHRALGVARLADVLICPSQALAGRMREAGVPADRLHHLPNVVEPVAPGVGPGEGWVYAGRVAEEKGVFDLLAAAGAIPGTVVGDGPALAEARRRAPPSVRFTGALPHPRALEVLRGARVVVVPSRWPENDPYAVTEAQALGRAVVATAVGGIPEQIRHGVDGWLVPRADPRSLARALARFTEDAALATVLGENGRARVQNDRNPVDHVTRLVALYALARDRCARCSSSPPPS